MAFIYNPEFTSPLSGLSGGSLPDEVKKTSRALAIRTTGVPFRNAADDACGIEAFAAEPDGGLVGVIPK